MRTITRLVLAASLLFVPATALFAQAAVDPSGHWTWAIHVPPVNGAGSREVAIDIDLAKDARGALDGTFGQPGQNIKSLPLSTVTLEGRTADVNGKQERLVLKMSNRADGTATGTIVDLDGSAVEIPIAVTQKASTLTLEVAAVGASYVAVLKSENELVGIWAQGSITLPLTFTRGTK